MAAHAATGLAEAQGKSIDQVGELLKFKDQSSGDPSNLFRYFFSEPKSHPFHLVAWKKRDCRISSGDNKVVFEQLGAEFPQAWSQMACNIVASKYLHGELKSPERESGLKDLLSRVTESIVDWAKKDGSLSSAADERCFQHELSHILLHQYAAFNSPVWFNVGVRPNPQCSACFILAVDDTMDALLDLQALEGRLFKYGSGTGTNLSTLRSTKERLSGGGTPSGPVSFMRAFDAWAGIIKSGGKTRRAAKMQILNVDHPDIVDFVECKTKEEKKAWALIEQGYDGSFSAQDGAYQAVAFQNANLSVRADDTFMEAARDRKTYWTHRVADGSPCEELDARKMLEKIAAGTHLCGDPGMQFDTIINKWHTCPNSGRINASNPCSEYMHLDNSACNLASINLLRYLDEQCNFNIEAICHTIRQLITAQDALIDHASYPSDKIEKCARDFRQLGLGYANLGALLMSLGFAYDSDGGREWAAVLTALMTGEAYRCSALLAKKIGPFKGFSANRSEMLKVLEMHYQELRKINPQYVSPELYQSACRSWEEAIKFGTEFGFRNSQTTVLAPTGTISFMMDCDTTGIEPDISLVKYKRLADGGLLKIANRTVARALDRLGYRQEARNEILKWIETHDTIEGCQTLQPEHLEIFDCALRPANGVRYISHMGHLRMMAAVQPFISGAISKTVNLPKDISVEEIADIYLKAWEMGIKAVALYRDGSKRTQPLNIERAEKKETAPAIKADRRRLPDERRSITHKFTVAGLEGYLTVGLFEDGSPGEIFLRVAKEGSTLSGMMDGFATSISLALQYGVPLQALVRKFTHMRFEPAGFTSNKEIPMAKSVIDYVFRWLAHKFLESTELSDLGLKTNFASNGHASAKNELTTSIPVANGLMSTFKNSEDAPPCTACGSSMMVRQAGCYVCLNCGAQGGCG